MRAEPWLDEAKYGIKPAISFGCDYCATTRLTRDVAGWHETDMTDEATMSAFEHEADVRFSVVECLLVQLRRTSHVQHYSCGPDRFSSRSARKTLA
jgi:hypothetical protein